MHVLCQFEFDILFTESTLNFLSALGRLNFLIQILHLFFHKVWIFYIHLFQDSTVVTGE